MRGVLLVVWLIAGVVLSGDALGNNNNGLDQIMLHQLPGAYYNNDNAPDRPGLPVGDQGVCDWISGAVASATTRPRPTLPVIIARLLPYLYAQYPKNKFQIPTRFQRDSNMIR